MKKPFGIPSRDTRLARFPFPPEAKSTIPVHAFIMASIMAVPDGVYRLMFGSLKRPPVYQCS
jgi:hypothetical protein